MVGGRDGDLPSGKFFSACCLVDESTFGSEKKNEDRVKAVRLNDSAEILFLHVRDDINRFH